MDELQKLTLTRITPVIDAWIEANAPSKDQGHLKARLSYIEAFDLSFIVPKLIEEGKGVFNQTNTDLGIRELKRFLSLMLLCDATHTPSAQLDIAWHQFIIFTKQYRRFCQDSFGGYLDHNPRLPTDPHKDGNFEHTLNCYRTHYGEPPAEMWEPFPKLEVPNFADLIAHLVVLRDALDQIISIGEWSECDRTPDPPNPT